MNFPIGADRAHLFSAHFIEYPLRATKSIKAMTKHKHFNIPDKSLLSFRPKKPPSF